MEDIISTPIWFNKNLRTSFDSEISLAGFDFIKDLFPQNLPVENFNGLRPLKIRKLRNIVNRIPPFWRDMIDQSGCKQIAVIPNRVVNLNDQDVFMENAKPENIYDHLIEPKIKMPVGLQHWLENMDLSDSDIKTGFTFAQKCSRSTFDQIFQYKIMTQILPTNKYLHQYRIIVSDLCNKCTTTDTVLHRLWQCSLLVPYRDKIIFFLPNSAKFRKIFH